MDETRSHSFLIGDGLAVTFERARLLIEAGPDAGLEYQLEEWAVRIGRGEDATLQLSDSTVSRSHAAIQPCEGGWRVKDLDSKGGTYLDGTRVEAAPLQDGARIRLGETEILFRTRKDQLPSTPTEGERFAGLVGASPQIRQVFGLIRKIAELELPVLLFGESGTGKEALAGAIHAHSQSREGPYEVVDCTLLDREHLRSELLGHVKGAFTGAVGSRKGVFERADGGTVFLDEIGELPLEIQPALLRVLEEGEVRPLGGSEAIRVRTRVVCATNRNLQEMVASGGFRKDLFYRLSAIVVEIPPLRERTGDTRLLAKHFLPEGSRLSPAALEALDAHPWPGNVRELKSVIQLAAHLAPGGMVEPETLRFPAVVGGPSLVERAAPAGPGAASPSAAETSGGGVSSLKEAEKQAILDALDQCDGNQVQAAKLLGIDRSTLYRKLKRLGLK